ncbi:hypothetical protein D9O36_02490 [Zobellia amurskyensis]|uniref:Carboxypeptidase-like protein n=1 Tax=Zobellia amurskyensis TaxID=248905 RepID=A0A7X3CZX9_9FLAO|nr:carboxypeptidase regulatory-like domain-containing protein [Zobellia amurskyensis]MUH34699.1 hypothetical protein [Zobellia amurskyensis]
MYPYSKFISCVDTLALIPRLFIPKKITIMLMLLTIPVLSSSQSLTITGNVIEEESSIKIAGAIVTIEGTAFVESTNSNGEFNFNQNIPEGEHVVTVTKDGYEKVFFLINVVKGKKLVVDAVKMEMTKQERKKRKKTEKKKKAKLRTPPKRVKNKIKN